jgi:replicative DNA helicase
MATRKLIDILGGSSGGNFRDRWNNTSAADDFGVLPAGEYVAKIFSGDLESSRTKSTPGLLDRQLARLSGVDVQSIRYRRLGAEHADRIDQAIHTLESVADRLCFVRPPFDLANIAATADAFDAGLIVLDYIQRIAPPGDHGDKRSSVDATMQHLRNFADSGVAVIVVAAVGRTKDKQGRSSYDGDGLNLASFRESSELEFGADDAFILVPHSKEPTQVVLRHLKARHTEPRDLTLEFDRTCQQFKPVDYTWNPDGDAGKLSKALSAAWQRTTTAHDESDGDL